MPSRGLDKKLKLVAAKTKKIAKLQLELNELKNRLVVPRVKKIISGLEWSNKITKEYRTENLIENLKSLLKTPKNIYVNGSVDDFIDFCRDNEIPIGTDGHSEQDGNSYSSSWYVDRVFLKSF